MNGTALSHRPMAEENRSYEVQDDEGSASASSDVQPLEDANNSFSDVSLASLGPPRSPARPMSRLSRRALAEHQAATNSNGDYLHREHGELQDLAGSLQDSIPEMLRIKDLDSGKEYNLDKVLYSSMLVHFLLNLIAYHVLLTLHDETPLDYQSQICEGFLLLAT